MLDTDTGPSCWAPGPQARLGTVRVTVGAATLAVLNFFFCSGSRRRPGGAGRAYGEEQLAGQARRRGRTRRAGRGMRPAGQMKRRRRVRQGAAEDTPPPPQERWERRPVKALGSHGGAAHRRKVKRRWARCTFGKTQWGEGKVHFWARRKVAEHRPRERLNAWHRSGSAAGQGSLLGKLPKGEIKCCRAGKALAARPLARDTSPAGRRLSHGSRARHHDSRLDSRVTSHHDHFRPDS